MKYEVTDAAGKTVAGMDSPGKGKLIELTERQAEHPLRLGHIKIPEKRTPRKKETKPTLSLEAKTNDGRD